MAIFDVFELTHTWRDNDGRVGVNRYHYRYAQVRGLGIETDEEALSAAWIDSVLTPMNATIPVSYTTTEVRVRNLFRPDYVWVEPMSLAGGRSGAGSELLPQFNAVKITLSHNSGIIKKGRKMMGGFYESDQINGLLTLTGYTNFVTRAVLCVIWIADAITAGQKSFEPIVVKSIPVIEGGKTIGYRMPENGIELVYATVLSALPSAVVTSQNTRKD